MKNIEQIRKQKGVTLVDIADHLGIKYQTVRSKIDGDTEFTFGEAADVWKTFFPEYDFLYLFSKAVEA